MRFVKKVWEIIVSMKTMVVLSLIFAFSIAAATFIENDFGTETAWALVYGAKWFEALQLLLGINLAANIVRFRLYRPKKFPAFLFHLGFLFILLGSALTRYYGYEGVLHIREGQSEERMLSADAFLQIDAEAGGERKHIERKIFLSAIGGNDFGESFEVGGKKVRVRFKDYIKNVQKRIAPDPDGRPMVSFAVATPSGPEDHILEHGEYTDLGPILIAFGDEEPKGLKKPYLYVYTKDGKFYFRSNVDVELYDMASRKSERAEAGREHPLTTKRLYFVHGVQIVPKEALLAAKEELVPKKEGMKGMGLSALVVEVDVDGAKRDVALLGMGRRFRGFSENIELGGVDLRLEWGSKELKLPFSLHLEDFVIEKYPGSMSPSSYESHVVLLDPKKGVRMPYKIYMNHTLEYGGYKFFQSSYDKDERGTILSVNHDPGKWPTYIGYILLGIGFFLNLLNPYSRFGRLARTRYVAPVLLGGLLALAAPLQAADPHAAHAAKGFGLDMQKVIETIKKVDKEHAERFGTILVQGHDGRIKPIDTVAIDIVNKIHGSGDLYGLTHNQVVLGMTALPAYWKAVKMIRVDHPGIKELLGMAPDEKYFAFIDIFDAYGNYKLQKAVMEASRKRPAARSKFDKELLKVDERINIAYMVYTGEFMRAFPLPGDPNDTWYTPAYAASKFPPKLAAQVRAILEKNFAGFRKGIEEGDWSVADEAVEEIKAFQRRYGAKIIPPKSRIEAELLYNRLDIFNRLVPVYLLSGLALLLLIFLRLLKPSLNLRTPTRIVVAILFLAFLAHTFALGLRWYVAGHAPWSNGYEAMLYISWSIILAGILFARQSEFAVASTAIFAGITLFVAHLSWLDPQITTMVPVLKSYWLTIHVSVITASYGFLGLSALLGFIALVLFVMLGLTRDEERRIQIILNIKEANRINEMSMIVGLSLLTLGNFLGGVWANESWGRYWGWDPKETWALVTILVYTALVHLRFVPKVWNAFSFAALSVVAYSSVVMTYFGVNYYLSGLHSYAGGDPLPIPTWVYWAVAVVAGLILLAYRSFAVYTALEPEALRRVRRR